MMMTTQSKTLPSLNVSLKPEGIATGNPVQVSKQLADLSIANPLASIVHQADKNGKQQPILTGLRRDSSSSTKGQHRGSFRNIFVNIWSALGSHEQPQDLDKTNQRRSSLSKPKTASVSKEIQLRPNLLPSVSPDDANKKCLVLDLDETLVHSSFRPTDNADFVIPIDIDGTTHHVYVMKRPGAEEFLVEMAKYYEIVVYTASLSKYADPLLDKLDPEGTIRYRLYREHCVQYEGNYVKDLSLLDRDLSQTIIVDNSPAAYTFHPRNAIGCSSFIDDENDRELASISRFLTKYCDVEDVRDHLQLWDANY